MTDWTFRAVDVTKSYDNGKSFANDRLTLRVEPGEVYGLLGPNGAGKTTLVKQTVGLLKPDAGTIMLGPMTWSPTPTRPDSSARTCRRPRCRSSRSSLGRRSRSPG